MSCQHCKSERVASVNGKTADCCSFDLGARRAMGYVPSGVGVGGGDYLKFDYCLDCGQIQGKWPIQSSDFES